MQPLDEDLVAQIYRDHGAALRRFVGRSSIDHDRVDDVVQETVLRVWKHAPEVTHLRAYLFQTARHILIDLHRTASRRVAEVGQAGDDPTSRDPLAADPAADIDRALDTILVEDALARLQPAHREVVRALYYRRLSVAEAALALGVPAGTVKSRAYYAVRSLRAVLDEMGVTR